MKTIPFFGMTLLAVALAAALSVFILDSAGVSTLELDGDLTSVAGQIAVAETESQKYSGGLIKSLLDLRLAILRNTSAMLNQKRSSFIRHINLRYTIEGKQLPMAPDSELREILNEIAKAENSLAASKSEASRTGGLIQTMALLKVQTDEVSVSQLRMKFYSAKYGIPMIFPKEATDIKTSPPGKIVKDREAL